MTRRSKRLVVRNGDGTFTLRLTEQLVDVLGLLAGQVDPLLDDPTADPGLRRLFPPAHADDVLAEAEWQIEQGGHLRDSRRAAFAALAGTTGADPLTEDELITWVQGLNALRLVLAERLGIDGDEDAELVSFDAAVARAGSDDEAEAADGRRVVRTWQVYDHLGRLLDDAVTALSDAL